MEKFDIENFPTSRAAVDMLHSISEGFYQDSYVMKWLLQVEGLEWDSAESILGGGFLRSFSQKQLRGGLCTMNRNGSFQ